MVAPIDPVYRAMRPSRKENIHLPPGAREVRCHISARVPVFDMDGRFAPAGFCVGAVLAALGLLAVVMLGPVGGVGVKKRGEGD